MNKNANLFKEDLINFIQKYVEVNGETPKAKNWKVKDGFPCSREFLHKEFLSENYTYNDLLEESGFKKRMPFNAKQGEVKEEDLIKFIQEYYKKNGVVPCLKQWKEKDGFPCNKEYLANNYKYNDLVAKAGFNVYKYGQRHYNISKLLEDLRKAVIESRCFNINILNKKFDYIKHRDTYTRLFGEFENALLAAGIENRHKILINRFDDYKLEDPIEFLQNKFGINGTFTKEQNELIASIKHAAQCGDLRRKSIGKKISLHRCRKLFETYSIALIAAGFNPAKTMRSRIKAKDGHMCDSYEESLVDNILYSLNIPHQVHTGYDGSNYICDFKIEDKVYIEYTGFGRIKSDYLRERYMDKIDEKKKIAKQLGINLIIIDEVNENTVDLIKRKVVPLLKGELNIKIDQLN